MRELDTVERNWSMAAHLSGALAMFFLPVCSVAGPALVLLLHKDSPTITYHARQALLFQAAMMASIWLLGAMGTALSCFLVGFLLYFVALVPWALGLAVPVWAGLQVNNGESFRYPLIGRWVEEPPEQIW